MRKTYMRMAAMPPAAKTKRIIDIALETVSNVEVEKSSYRRIG
jgi:hypothetical protein